MRAQSATAPSVDTLHQSGLPQIGHGSAFVTFRHALFMACPLLAINELPQVGHVVHGPRANLHGGQLAGASKVVHSLRAKPAQQSAGLRFIDQYGGERLPLSATIRFSR
jgi:hypothetical protein